VIGRWRWQQRQMPPRSRQHLQKITPAQARTPARPACTTPGGAVLGVLSTAPTPRMHIPAFTHTPAILPAVGPAHSGWARLLAQ
jgi:hypothetical protein